MQLQPNTRYRCVTYGDSRYNEVFITAAFSHRAYDGDLMFTLLDASGQPTARSVYVDRDYAAKYVDDVYEPEFVPGQYYRVTRGKGPFSGRVLCAGTCFYVNRSNTAIITTPGANTHLSARDDNFSWFIGSMPADTVTEKVTAKEAIGDLRVGDVFKLVTNQYATSNSRYHCIGDEYKIVDADNNGSVETAHASYGTTFWDYPSLTNTTKFALVERGQIPTEESAPCRFDPNDQDYALEYVSDDDETEMEEAARITTTDRNDTYGDPAEDHARTGRMWGATLGIDDIPAETVALMMAQLKISREVHKPGRDNRVDAHGYLDNRRAILESKGQA